VFWMRIAKIDNLLRPTCSDAMISPPGGGLFDLVEQIGGDLE